MGTVQRIPNEYGGGFTEIVIDDPPHTTHLRPTVREFDDRETRDYLGLTEGQWAIVKVKYSPPKSVMRVPDRSADKVFSLRGLLRPDRGVRWVRRQDELDEWRAEISGIVASLKFK
jgi:hypothetical protein